MKKTIFLLTFIFFINSFVNAQESEGEKIKALKIAFITEQVNLTSSEAQKFWPVYNKFDELIHQLERVEKHKLRTKISNAGGINKLSEEEAKSLMKQDIDLDKQVFNTKTAYDIELTKVLSYKKILKLKNAERDFVRNLMKNYRSRSKKSNNK